MQITALQLIQSWNALNEVLSHNNNPEVTTKVKKWLKNNKEIKNEVDYWNSLNAGEKQYVISQGEEFTLDIGKLDTVPDNYKKCLSNEEIKSLQRFVEPDLEINETHISKLLDEAAENGYQENEKS